MLDIDYRIQAGIAALLAELCLQHERVRDDARLDDVQKQNLIREEYQLRWRRGERPAGAPTRIVFPSTPLPCKTSPRAECLSCWQAALCLDEDSDSAGCSRCGTRFSLAELFPPLDPRGLDLREYRLRNQIGRGGMGEAYRSGDPGLGRDLASKVQAAARGDL